MTAAAKFGTKCRQYAFEREIDKAALAYAYAGDARRKPAEFLSPQPCFYVPAAVRAPGYSYGAVDVGGQFVFCDSDLQHWRGRHPEQAEQIASKRTLSNAERDTALSKLGFVAADLCSVRAVGLDKLPLIAADAERRSVPVVVVLTEGISDYLTALSIVSPYDGAWRDAAQCVVGALGCGQLAAAAEAAYGAVGASETHLVVIAHDDSRSANQGALGAYSAVLRWQKLGGRSACLLVCGDDLSSDHRAHDADALGAVWAACDDRGGLSIAALPGGDTDHVLSVIAERNAAARAKLASAQAPQPSKRRQRSRSRQPFASFEDVAAALASWGAVSDGAGGWRAKCPAHRGQDRNMSLCRGDDDTPIVRCWSRDCGYEDILRSLGLWVEL